MIKYDNETYVKNDTLFIENGVIKMIIDKPWVIFNYCHFHKNFKLLDWLVKVDVLEKIENGNFIEYIKK